MRSARKIFHRALPFLNHSRGPREAGVSEHQSFPAIFPSKSGLMRNREKGVAPELTQREPACLEFVGWHSLMQGAENGTERTGPTPTFCAIKERKIHGAILEAGSKFGHWIDGHDHDSAVWLSGKWYGGD